MADTGQELIEKALAAVESRVQAQIEQVRQRRERQRQQREELAAARNFGLAKRYAQRLRNQANAPSAQAAPSPTDRSSPEPGDRSQTGRGQARAGGSVNEGARS
ncbi:hypothetical protein [Streptomyces lincolnensis]|uniref:hypothetical protein n=1 Tax=Streptomyces lincolnensis TaxID=1915 RepID=UPI0037CCE345